ncbi:MAG: HAMP domain-containing histidine kinase [Lachnospiraceae bacterium]|nr:HAMP domain-containing histidine kinase [Lachnospiraceae bacterium]
MKKKVLGSKKREFLLFMERILVVLLAVSMSIVFMNSFLTINSSYGTSYRYIISPLEQDMSFEDKEIFRILARGNMEQIARYVVIQSQLETDGKYDAKKKIDISSFANRSQTMVEEQPTAQFYLDDLIKWGNYGFTYNTVIGTWDELNQLFAKNEAVYTRETIPGVKEYDHSGEADALSLGLVQGENDQYAMEVLVSRYKTVDGKELMECAESVEEYEQLKENLVLTAKSLFSNYTEYTKMQEEYSNGKTNMGFCFQIQTDEGLAYYTNSKESYAGMSADNITAGIKEKGGRFLYFNPDKLQINTNMEITAAQMRTILKPYEYLFGDNTRVWFWIDTNYPIQDDFYTVRESFTHSLPLLWTLMLVSLAAFTGSILIMFYLTRKEGRVLNEEGELEWRIQTQDRIFLGLWLLFTLIPQYLLLRISWELYVGYRAGTINYSWLPVVAGMIAFLINEWGIRLYFSLVRRIKAKALWRTTLLRKIWVESRNLAIKTYDNGGLVSRTWIPYLIFLMVNLIMVLLGFGGVVGAFLLDMLIGVYLYRDARSREEIINGIEMIKDGKVKYRIDTTHLHGENLKLANSVNTIGSGIHKAVETSMKDEKLKTDLITNVSHDIKTPLTSIITYVDLLKREQIGDEKVRGYLEVLDNKSQRLKQLIDDLVEASKISSGNIHLQFETINFVELVRQALGEFSEKFEDRQLQVVTRLQLEHALIEADSSQLWRVLENLFQNIAKYAMKGTRVYVEMEESFEGNKRQVVFSAKNISDSFLEVQAEELTERFIRGDKSRQTEGSGLGLSIAKNLIEAQDGEFEVQVDGDLFKVIISFPVLIEK